MPSKGWPRRTRGAVRRQAARIPHLGAHGGCCTAGNCEALNDDGRQLVVRDQTATAVGRVGSMVTHAPALPAALPHKQFGGQPVWKGWPWIDTRHRGHRFSFVAGSSS
jgi:hypothetical protein